MQMVWRWWWKKQEEGDVKEQKWRKIQPHPRNWAPAGPTSISRLASPSPSTIGGGDASLCLLASRQVILVGAVHFLGGMIMRMPLWRLPLMEPPLASTMKLTRNLMESETRVRKREEEWKTEEGRNKQRGGGHRRETQQKSNTDQCNENIDGEGSDLHTSVGKGFKKADQKGEESPLLAVAVF